MPEVAATNVPEEFALSMDEVTDVCPKVPLTANPEVPQDDDEAPLM